MDAANPTPVDSASPAGGSAALIAPWLDDSFRGTKRLRHDGWTSGENRGPTPRPAPQIGRREARDRDASHDPRLGAASL